MQIGLILIALAFPLLELAVLIKTGQIIGFWWTILLLAAIAVAGGALIHHQGLSATRRAMTAAREGRPPIEPVADSMLLILAGTLLIIPGLITDVAGLLLLVPALRRGFARWVFARLFAGFDTAATGRGWQDEQSDARFGERPRPGGPRNGRGGTVIDGEWERVDDPKPSKPPDDRGPERK